MAERTSARPPSDWPPFDPEGRPVRFTDRDLLPHPKDHRPVLQGLRVRLEPMSESHLDALCAVGLDPELYRLNPVPIRDREGMEAFIREAVEARDRGIAIPFVTVYRDEAGSEKVVGTTRFSSIDRASRRMEIGWTWIARPWQRTRVNTEAKYLMLRHAFEELHALRVELKTDSLNARSRAAILRIGATQEGVFRNHVVTSEGRVRHSVYFSFISEEWPTAKAHLERLLER